MTAPVARDWGVQTGFFQRRQPMFWLVVLLTLYGAFSVLSDQALMIEYVPAAWALSWVLVALYAIPVALVIRRLDLFEREPVSLVLAALAWGGLVAIAFAGPTNTALHEIIAKVAGPEVAREWGAALVAPPVEETLKVMGVIAIVLIARNEVDDLFDGFVYGAMSGLGFAIVENVQYFINFVVDGGTAADQVGPVIHGFFIRVIASGLYTHILWAGVAGLGVAYAATRVDLPSSRRYGVAAAAFLAAILGHAFWNSPLLGELFLSGDAGPLNWLLYAAAKGVPFLILVGLLLRLSTRREHATYRALVASHPSSEVATEAELGALGNLLTRRAARKAAGRERGPAAEAIVRRLQREQVHFGMIRSRATRDDDPDLVACVERIRAIRTELLALPLIATGPAPGTTGVGTTGATAAAGGWNRPAAASSAPPPWAPTHLVPAGGLPAWDAPDPARQPVVTLAERLELVVDERAGDWARVRAVNGWTGWVDARRLTAR